MVQSVLEMSGLEKASVLLMSLGPEISNEVLECLTPEQRELLGAQIVKMRRVRTPIRQRVLDEVNRSVSAIRQKNARARDASDSEPPLRWLEERDPAEIAAVLSHERPHNAALVISHLSANGAASVLPLLDETSRNQVTHRLATMGPVSPAAATAVDEVMRERLLSQSARGEHGSRPSRTPIVASAVDSVPSDDRTTSCRSPEDLALMPQDELKDLLAQLNTDDLCLALKVASGELTSAVLANVGDDVERILRQSLANPTQPKVREIEAARGRIVNALSAAVEHEAVSLGGAESE